MKIVSESRGRNRHYTVLSDSGEEYNLCIQTSCTCVYGTLHQDKRICKHVRYVLNKILEE